MNLNTGTVFDSKFIILELLGSGGMGTVFKAKQLGTERTVALKLLSNVLTETQESRARFEREAKILCLLEHDNIASFFMFGLSPEQVPYLAMEYISGNSLRKQISLRGRLPWKQAANIAAQVCDALAYAHGKGILHRDLKPENILLDEQERVVLIDFGLSKITDPQALEVQKLTKTGDLIGTANYLSPEMCSGNKIDSRTDIYSLGIILYEAISGSPPFSADTPIGVIYQHVNEKAPALRKKGVDLPAKLEEIIIKCISKAPNDRYQTAGILAEELRSLENSSETTAKKESHPVFIAIAIAAVLVLALVLFLAFKKPVPPHLPGMNIANEKKRQSTSMERLILSSQLGSMRFNQLKKQIDYLFEQENYSQANKLIKTWLALREKSSPLTPEEISGSAIALGITESEADDNQGAFRTYEEAIKKLQSIPNNKDKYTIPLLQKQIESAGWTGSGKQSGDATRELEKILHDNKSLSDEMKRSIHISIASAKMSQGRWEEVLNMPLDRSIQDATFLRFRAQCLFHLGRIEEGKTASRAFARAFMKERRPSGFEDEQLFLAHQSAVCAAAALQWKIAADFLGKTLHEYPKNIDKARADALIDYANWNLYVWAGPKRNSGPVLNRQENWEAWLKSAEESLRDSQEAADIYGRLKSIEKEWDALIQVAYFQLILGREEEANITLEKMTGSNPDEQMIARAGLSLWEHGSRAKASNWATESILMFKKAKGYFDRVQDPRYEYIKQRNEIDYLSGLPKNDRNLAPIHPNR